MNQPRGQITGTSMRRRKASKRRAWCRPGLFSLLVLASASIGALGGLALIYSVGLPQIHDLNHYRPISNTVLYDDQGRAFGSFALQRRIIAQYDDFPKVLYDAVLSTEDRNFERHYGFEPWRMLVAAGHDLRSGGNVQGASTLTMQLARNLFLSPERTYSRKIREVMLAVQIERHFTKPQIFALYANQIYLGHGVYGFATGAQYYFGKAVKDLTLEEAAMLAALPKAPNNYSPIRSPERALRRRNLVIDSMIAAGKIGMNEGTAGKKTSIRLQIHDDPNALAPYFVEEIRQYLEKRYGTEQVHEAGLRVYTTLNIDLQKAANTAVLDGLAAYERRHGWRTHLQQFVSASSDRHNVPQWNEVIEPGNYTHAEVIAVSSTSALMRVGRYTARVGPNDISWTNSTLPQLLSPGDLAYVRVMGIAPDGKAQVRFEEESGVQGALLAIDSASGEVKAMVGGRDFNQSKFNRATQAMRQVGSSFKPYVYTSAIDQGATPEDEVSDTPATFMTASGPYSPHNYDEKFEGSITLTHALAESRNVPAVRLAQRLGIKTVIGYARRFGIRERIPPYLPVALGAVELTLLEHTSAFSAFPNDGERAMPHYIVKVTDFDGRILEQNYPSVQNVISARTARTMTSMLRDVVLHGTGVAATHLRYPVAGKTGTTNDFTDAWFLGFSPSLTCGVWVGFDEKKTLGNKETGARVALPIWMDFMATALPQLGPRRDFLPVPEKNDRMLARQADDLSIGQELRNSGRHADSELSHVSVEPVSKRTMEQPNSVSGLRSRFQNRTPPDR
jgi:penicillin-binding protein 1A